MKSIKSKIAFLSVALAAMALAACGSSGGETSNAGGNGSSSRRGHGGGGGVSEPSYGKLSDVDAKVTFKVDGAVVNEQTVKQGEKITKPADPTAPAGKTFYGWMQKANGGRIWNFERGALNRVMEDMELEPLFVDAGAKTQLLEAELCRAITDDGGMDGSTYSGGAKGQQLIYKDYDDAYDCTSATKLEYYEVAGQKFDAFDLEPEDLSVATKKSSDFEHGAFVHFLYNKGSVLTFDIELDKAASNVTLFGRYSGEYGQQKGVGEEYLEGFKDDEFIVKVNGEALKYGEVTIHNIVPKTYIPFQDFLLSTSVNLKAGKNKIELIVDNNRTLDGTIQASSPCIDSIKVLTDATISWPEAKFTNLL